MSASSEIAGGKEENDLCDGVDDSQNGMHKHKARRHKKHILASMEKHKYHKLKKKYALLGHSMAKLRHHVKKLEKETDRLRQNFLELQQSSAQVIQRKDTRIQELTDQVQQYISQLQTSQLIHRRDQTRRLSRDLGHRSHHSQSPDDRGHPRHVTRRDKRTREASYEREDSREKRRREDEHHTRRRQTGAVTHPRSRLGDSTGVRSRGYRDRGQYRSTSQHSASPRDKRRSESRTESPAPADGVNYHSDPDLTTSRSHHDKASAREHGDVSSTSGSVKQGRNRTYTLDEENIPFEHPEAADEAKEGPKQPPGISDEERMMAYIYVAQRRTLDQQIAFKESRKLRNRMIADYTSRAADHAQFIASLPKRPDKETDADVSDSDTSCNSRLCIADDRPSLTAFDDGDAVAKSVTSMPSTGHTDGDVVASVVAAAPTLSLVGSTEISANVDLCTKQEPVVEPSVDVVKETTHPTDPRLRRRIDAKPESMSSQNMPITPAPAVICMSLIDGTGYGNTGSMRTKDDVSVMDTHETRVPQDDTAPLGMLLSVLKQSCKPSQPVQRPPAVQTTQSPPVADILNMLFGQTRSSPVSHVTSSTGETAEITHQECSKTDRLTDAGLKGFGNSQQVNAMPYVPATVTQPCRTQGLKCAGTIQETEDMVVDISKRNSTSVTRDVESSLGDVKTGKAECFDDVKSGKDELGDATGNNAESLCDVKPSKTEPIGDVLPDSAVSSQNAADTTNDSETSESHTRIVEESANSSISRRDVRRCTDPGRGNDSEKRHTSKHKKRSTAHRSTTELSCNTSTQRHSVRETKEITEQNDVVIPRNDLERETGGSDCLATASVGSQPGYTVAETGAIKPTETYVDSVFADDEEYDDDSDFAFVIDTNVSPVSSDVDDASVSRKDEDLWDISLQSDDKQDPGKGTPVASESSKQVELARSTDDAPMNNDDPTVNRTPTVAIKTDAPKARLHVRDPRHVVTSRDRRKPDIASSRRRSASDDSKVRSASRVKPKPSSLASSSTVEQSDESKKVRRMSDQQLRRKQKETCENRRPMRHEDRAQKDGARRHSESRNVEGATSQTTKCDNDRVTASASVSKIHGTMKETGPAGSVPAARDHRTRLSGSVKRAHRVRDDVKSGGSPANKRAPHTRTDVKSKPLTSGGNSSNKPAPCPRDDHLNSGESPPHEIVLKSRDEMNKQCVTSDVTPSEKRSRRSRDDLKSRSLSSGGIPTNKNVRRARDELKNNSRISGGIPPNKSAHRTRDESKNRNLTSGETPPNKRRRHSRDDSKKNPVARDESVPSKTTLVARDDVTSSHANEESPAAAATQAVVNDKDTPVDMADPCATETQDDSMEEGEILSDEDSVSTGDKTVKRRGVEPRGSSDGVHRTHSRGANRERPSHHVSRRRPSHSTTAKH